MENLSHYYHRVRRYLAPWRQWMLIPSLCYLELLFRIWIGGSLNPLVLMMLIGSSVCVGSVLNAIAAALPRKWGKWFTVLSLFIATVLMVGEYLIGDAYSSYMRPVLAFASAGGVITDFADIMLEMIFHNLHLIFIALIPIFLYLLAWNGRMQQKSCIIGSLKLAVAAFFVGFMGLSTVSGSLNSLWQQYDFSTSMQRNGVTISMLLELTGAGHQAAAVPLLVIPEVPAPTVQETAPPTEQTTVPPTEQTIVPTTEAPIQPAAETTAPTVVTEPDSAPTEDTATAQPQQEIISITVGGPAETDPTKPEYAPPVYKPHTVPWLDFAKLYQTDTDPVRRSLYQYIMAQEPAMENEYTGLFRGKNLILITAEAFDSIVIDPELTPTLYRLVNQGIHFTNYYQPLWTGNTSGGELVNLSGLAMNCEMLYYSSQKPFNTMGRQLMNLGYFSRAYHNNGYYFYDRDKTHANLGYEKYIGMGNGMEAGVRDVWPASDYEMMEYTLGQYIDQQPFSIYYMTVSAHCRYSTAGNAMSRKNWSLVENLSWSSPVKAFIAANLELERGLDVLVSGLEAAGIADDTVIVLAPDHFPYGLGSSWCGIDALTEIYGKGYSTFDRDRNTLIIWSGCLEGKNLQIDSPVCSVDILPTLSNLFGLEYDSRLSVGRDVFSDEEAISFWPDYSWVTDLGEYNAPTRHFTPYTNDVPSGYVDRITAIVRNRMNFSRTIQTCSFFKAIQGAMQ